MVYHNNVTHNKLLYLITTHEVRKVFQFKQELTITIIILLNYENKNTDVQEKVGMGRQLCIIINHYFKITLTRQQKYYILTLA